APERAVDEHAVDLVHRAPDGVVDLAETGRVKRGSARGLVAHAERDVVAALRPRAIRRERRRLARDRQRPPLDARRALDGERPPGGLDCDAARATVTLAPRKPGDAGRQ